MTTTQPDPHAAGYRERLVDTILRWRGTSINIGDANLLADAIIALDRPVPPVAGEDHAGAIHEALNDLAHFSGTGVELMETIEQHADALAARLRASEAQRDRIFRELIDMRVVAITPHDRDEIDAIYGRASAVLNGTLDPESDMPADGEGDGS